MMHQFGAIASVLAILTIPTYVAAAEDQSNATGPTGSESVLTNGIPAKRAADIPGAITSPDVLINGQPVIIRLQQGSADPEPERLRQRQAQDPRLHRIILPGLPRVTKAPSHNFECLCRT